MSLKLNNGKAIMPQGEYRTFWAIYDKIDPDIYKLSYKAIVKSPYKSTFG